MDTSPQAPADVVAEAEYVIKEIEQRLFPAYRQGASEAACVNLAGTMKEHKKLLKQNGLTPTEAAEAHAAVSHLYFGILKELELHGRTLQIMSV